MGPLIDLIENPPAPDTMPDNLPDTGSSKPLASLTVVSVPGSSANGDTMVYVNPAKSGSNKYFYKTGKAPLSYPHAGDVISQTSWDGTSAISGTTTGDEIMIIETDSSGKALKAGVATITAKSE